MAVEESGSLPVARMVCSPQRRWPRPGRAGVRSSVFVWVGPISASGRPHLSKQRCSAKAKPARIPHETPCGRIAFATPAAMPEGRRAGLPNILLSAGSDRCQKCAKSPGTTCPHIGSRSSALATFQWAAKNSHSQPAGGSRPAQLLSTPVPRTGAKEPPLAAVCPPPQLDGVWADAA